MTKDILTYFPLNSKNEVLGLFEKPLNQRYWSNRPKKSINGVSYTQFPDAYEIVLSNKNTLFEMFHKNCWNFMTYFKSQNPEWIAYELRRETFYSTLIHAFCCKKLEDGRILFADARGITDNCLDFFEDFNFSKDSMVLKEVNILEPHNPLEDDCKKAYEYIYKKNKSF